MAAVRERLARLRTGGGPRRVRVLLLLHGAGRSGSELTEIVAQSQPRVSRHLKLLCEAGLLHRFKEGSWVFYRSAERGDMAQFAASLCTLADGSAEPFASDRRRFESVRRGRQAAAAEF